MKISVVIPALNEAEGIGETIKSLKGMHEIIVVDGGSCDKTVEIAEKCGAKVVIERRRGYGRAYKTGFEIATGDVLISMDADGTYSAEAIPGLLAEMPAWDFVTTNRFADMESGAMSRRNRIGNAILSHSVRLLYGLPLIDSQSGMWAMKKPVWDMIKSRIKSDGMAFSQEIKIAAWHLVNFKEIPISYKKRLGKAKLNAWKDGLCNLLKLIEFYLF